MKICILLFAACIAFNAHSQNTIQLDVGPCGMHGSAKKGSKEYTLNSLKNRSSVPGDADYVSNVSLEQVMKSADPNEFSTDSAITLEGYVFNVKVGGIESCNCKSKSQTYRDTHIELTPDADHTDSSFRVIVEVTPRMRARMKKQGINWSTAALKKSLIGHTVQVKGWLLYDAEHEDQASANDPDDQIGRKNFRATCWEVHPITELKVLQ